MSSLKSVSEDRVRAVAHSLWLEEGMPEGRAEVHWFKALDLVNAEASAKRSGPEAPKPRRKAAAKAPARAAPARKPAKS